MTADIGIAADAAANRQRIGACGEIFRKGSISGARFGAPWGYRRRYERETSKMSAPMNVLKQFAERVIDGWMHDYKVGWVLRQTMKDFNRDADSIDAVDQFAEELFGKPFYGHSLGTREWVARNFPTLNEALWNGRKREVLVPLALRCMGIKTAANSIPRMWRKSAREADKRHDWKTVK